MPNSQKVWKEERCDQQYQRQQKEKVEPEQKPFYFQEKEEDHFECEEERFQLNAFCDKQTEKVNRLKRVKMAKKSIKNKTLKNFREKVKVRDRTITRKLIIR